MTIARTNFDQKDCRACSVPTRKIPPYGQDRPLSGCNIRSLYGCHLLARKLRITLLWPIPIWAKRRLVTFVGLLSIAAGTCVDPFLSVAVFGLPALLPLVTNQSFYFLVYEVYKEKIL
ncbi:hypothetical protein AVEN_247241-1 [Araneus ventricosus]|uniref:Uncharacterized protein n=1 Tax=Araneus ventricosus TaxID=182803 RepID=A0A4Y2EU59_ARAVE|nr:hypothetical protein AVEN_247241-1 [Araneus ventricosus]